METPCRRDRTRILTQSPELRRQWAQAIEDTQPCATLEAPRAGLVMVQVRESARRSRFLLGEVLVTEAKVRVAGRVGLGMLRGQDDAAAYDLAVIDGACRAGVADEGTWGPRLASADEALARARAALRQALDATRVDFQTMDRPASEPKEAQQ